MKRLFIFFFLFMIGQHSLSSQNLVLNPGFESGNTNWYPYTTNSTYGTIQIDNSVSHSGNNSLRLDINNAPTPPFVTNLGAQWIKVNGDKKYLLECYVKTNTANGVAQPYIQFNKNGARQFGDGGLNTTQTTNWQKIHFRFYPPAACDTIQLTMGFSGVNGSAWFDDISLVELTDTSYTPFTVNMLAPTGNQIRQFMGINVGPIDPTVSSTLDLTSSFQDLGIDYVRIHDFEGPGDMHEIFPDTSRNALDSTAYNFTMTDSVIKAIVKSGANIYFRLGESGSNTHSYFGVPGDMDKWAQVCLQIVKHYNNGWNKGFHYNIKYWEIYNEPDTGPGLLFNGTVQDYIRLYRHTSKKIKQFDNTLKVGGPVVSNIFSSAFVNEFLDSVTTFNLPLDFFAYHNYHSLNPYNFVLSDNFAKQTLTNHGLGSTERIVSEWSNLSFSYSNNYFIWRDDPFMTASTAASLSYFQQTDVSKLMRYRADQTDLGIFYDDGNYNFSGLAYKAFSTFKGAPYQLATTGSDSLGTSILAGQTSFADAAAVLITNNNSSAKGYTVNFNGLNSVTQFTYAVYRVDSIHYLNSVASGAITSSQNTISIPAPKPPFMDIIILNQSTGISALSNNGNISVYPNPFNNSTSIKWKNISVNLIEISDISGRVIKTFYQNEFTSNAVQWNIGENNDKPAPGIYFVKLYSTAEINTLKIIITE